MSEPGTPSIGLASDERWCGVVRALGVGDIVIDRGLFVLPSRRVRGLSHWRDEIEASDRSRRVVAYEASKWARLVLKGHGGTLGALLVGEADVHPLFATLTGLAPSMVTDATLGWWSQAALGAESTVWADLGAAFSAPRNLVGGERFAIVEGWLQGAREWADQG